MRPSIKTSIKKPILMLILSAIATLSLACVYSPDATLVSPVSGTLPPLSTTLPTPTSSPTPASSGRTATTPTPSAPLEWELQNIDVDGSTVKVILRVFAGVEVRVTLDGASPKTVSGPSPVLEHVFIDVTPGVHTVEVSDLAGNIQAREISVSPAIVSAGLPGWLAQMILDFESQPPANPPLTISRYEYRRQPVYYQTASCCDIFSNLYNEEGELIAHPDGGITGRGDGRLPDFFQARGRESLVWLDAREPFGKNAVPILAPIDSIELQIAESFPLQYFLNVVSGLPDGCHSFGGYTLTRDSQRVLIKVFNLRPSNANLMCIQVYGTVETTIPLGSDFDLSETYTIDVNGKTISFRGDGILEETLKATPTPPEPANPSLVELQEELNQNRELWAAQGITDYQMEFRWNCFCPPEYVAPVIITVTRGDTIDSVAFAEGTLPWNRKFPPDYPSIAGLFDLIQGAIDRPAFHISVIYHAELGYPLSAAIDYDQRIADEEKGFQVGAVTKLK